MIGMAVGRGTFDVSGTTADACCPVDEFMGGRDGWTVRVMGQTVSWPELLLLLG